MSVNKSGSNLPAIIKSAQPVVDALAPVAGAIDSAYDKVLPIVYETPKSNSTINRVASAAMSFVYLGAACGSIIPFGGSIIGDAIVAGSGAALAAGGKRFDLDEVANQGRLAMQTGVVATGASALGFIPFVPGGILNIATYLRAAAKTGLYAIKGGSDN